MDIFHKILYIKSGVTLIPCAVIIFHVMALLWWCLADDLVSIFCIALVGVPITRCLPYSQG